MTQLSVNVVSPGDQVKAADHNNMRANMADHESRISSNASRSGAKAVGQGELLFNVMDYGAVGNGIADDTSAFQSAINAAVGASGTLVIIPPPNGSFIISNTLLIQPAGSATQTRLNIKGGGTPGAIRWNGPANIPVFQCYGWKRSTVEGVHVVLSNSVGGTTAWDIDTTTVWQSSSLVTFTGCAVGIGTSTYNRGWRLGHVSAGSGDISFFTWVNCNVSGSSSSTVTGQRGWLNEGGNTLNNVWYGGYGANLEKMVSNLSDAGTSGGDSMFFYGIGCTSNGTDFDFASPGSYTILGGRFETGNRFLNVENASFHPAVAVSGVKISHYAPSDGVLVNFGSPGSLTWTGNWAGPIGGTTAWTASMFTLGGFTGVGSLVVSGGALGAADPFWTNGGNWQVWVTGTGVLNSSNQTTTRLTQRVAAS